MWKIILFPFWIVKKIFGLFFGTSRMGFELISRSVKFMFKYGFLMLIGAGIATLVLKPELRDKLIAKLRGSVAKAV